MAIFVFNDGKAFIGGYDLSSHTTAINLEITAEELDATVINGGGYKTKIGGTKDSTFSLDGFFSAGANQPDALLGTSIGNELIVTAVPDAGIGNTAYFMKSTLFSYSIFGTVGELTPFSISKSISSDIVVRGTIALDTGLTASGNSAAYQLGAVASGDSCYAAVHCYGVSGTSTPTITFKLQSDDNSGFSSPTDRATFTALTAIGSEIKSVAGAVTDQYWRLNYTVSGTNPAFSIHATIGIE
jgi:hypothetical protein|tara:strand:- start:24 stop:749 length:726 start_codon:yes stop_codon:yes gene_type:complete